MPAPVTRDEETEPEEDPEEDPNEDEELAHGQDPPLTQRPPTSPSAPVSLPLTEDDEEYDPILDGFRADPVDAPPLSPPLPVVTLGLYDWMADTYSEQLAVDEARVLELEQQIATERRERAQGGRVDTSTRRMRSTMCRIEERAIGRVHRLLPLHGPVRRLDVTRIISDAMRRSRDATRVRDH